MSKFVPINVTKEQLSAISEYFQQEGNLLVKFIGPEGDVLGRGVVSVFTTNAAENLQPTGPSITKAQKERLLRLLAAPTLPEENKTFIRGYLLKEGLTKKGASKVIWRAIESMKEVR